MPLVPCGCAVDHPVCELGQDLFYVFVLWYDRVDAPVFLTCSFEEREHTLKCFRDMLNVWLAHCGYSVQEGGVYEK